MGTRAVRVDPFLARNIESSSRKCGLAREVEEVVADRRMRPLDLQILVSTVAAAVVFEVVPLEDEVLDTVGLSVSRVGSRLYAELVVLTRLDQIVGDDEITRATGTFLPLVVVDFHHVLSASTSPTEIVV